jgi:hypothetical protein
MSHETHTRCDGCGTVVGEEFPEWWIVFNLSEDYCAEIIGKNLGGGSYDSTPIATEDLHFCGVNCLSIWASRKALEYSGKKKKGS